MKKEEFYQEVKREVENRMGTEYIVDIQPVAKVNATLDGLTIRPKNKEEQMMSNVSPCIYLNGYYYQHQEGKKMEEIVKEVIQLNLDASYEGNINLTEVLDFKRIKEKIVFRLVSKENNLHLLETMPYEEIPELDLILLYYVVMNQNEHGCMGFPVKNQQLEVWGVSQADLKALAEINTKNHNHFFVKDLKEVVQEIFIDELSEVVDDFSLEDLEELTMSAFTGLVVTNQYSQFGAVALHYPELFEQVSERLESDLFIIPSSLHELIIISGRRDIEIEEMRQMIQEINAEVVDEKDILCNGLFQYLWKEKKIIKL